MRHGFFILICLLLAALACGDMPYPEYINLPTDSMTYNNHVSSTQGQTQPLVVSQNQFAWEIYQDLVTGQSGNLFYSPYSLYQALGMTYAGAGGETARQMAEVLNINIPATEFHAAMKTANLELLQVEKIPSGEDKSQVELTLLNQLWGQEGLNFLPTFLDTLSANYNSGMRLVDYKQQPEAARQVINAWVSDATQKHIQDMLQPGVIDQYTRLVLTNAIYYKANWEHEFEVAETQVKDFTQLEGQTVAIPMMRMVKPLPYADVDGVQIVCLPYVGGRLYMAIFLPDRKRFTDFESKLTSERVDNLLSTLSTREVALDFPRFTNTSEFNLKTTLARLGMPLAFSDSADFSGMTAQEPLEISELVHKAYIDVNETGTEAAAVSAIVMIPVTIPAEPVVMSVNHPFIYVIYDQSTSLILFTGRVMDPAS